MIKRLQARVTEAEGGGEKKVVVVVEEEVVEEEEKEEKEQEEDFEDILKSQIHAMYTFAEFCFLILLLYLQH